MTISALATAGATLVLAIATFGSVRSANRAARAAEGSLLAGLRPLLMPSRPDDPELKVGFADNRWFHVPGGGAVVEVAGDVIYLAMSVRNVASGLAVLHGWYLHTQRKTGEHPPLDEFRRLTRDLYIAAGEVGFWQGAFRDPAEPVFPAVRAAIENRAPMSLDVLYGDHEGGQRTVSRFLLTPRDGGGWLISVGRHWSIDRPGPR